MFEKKIHEKWEEKTKKKRIEIYYSHNNLVLLSSLSNQRETGRICLLFLVLSFWLACVVPIFLLDDEMQERLYDSQLFFLFSSSPSFPFCSNNSSSSVTITINYKMIKSTQSTRIASFFPFFLYPTTVLVRWSLRLYIYIYTERMHVCFLVSIRNDWPQRLFEYSRALLHLKIRLLFDICKQWSKIRVLLFILSRLNHLYLSRIMFDEWCSWSNDKYWVGDARDFTRVIICLGDQASFSSLSHDSSENNAVKFRSVQNSSTCIYCSIYFFKINI